ncbi:hypothetical protein ABT348_24135 [Streptomyces olivaceus]|uniref:hypothetical protein n=1 Tax=Streptomyces olivaceus TaxID=47716 RepID=UPI0033248E1C
MSTMPEDRYAERPLAEQIEQAETDLARAEHELVRSGGDERAARIVQSLEEGVNRLRDRQKRAEAAARAQRREAERAAQARKEHAGLEKKHAAELKKERTALVASRDKAESAVIAAGEAVRAALEALREHSEAVGGAADRLEALGLSLVDEYGNQFEQGGRRPRGISKANVALDGDGFTATYHWDRERRVTETVRKAVEGARPTYPSLRSMRAA